MRRSRAGVSSAKRSLEERRALPQPFQLVPNSKVAEVARMLKAIHVQ